MEEPKDPDTCLVFQLYSLFANEEQKQELAVKYRGGNFGYGHAKQELYLLLNERMQEPRERYMDLRNRPDDVADILAQGAQKARSIARDTVDKVRAAVGL